MLSPSLLRHPRLPLCTSARALLALLALSLLAGCGDGGVKSAGGEDASVDTTGCLIDPSRDPASAVPLEMETMVGQRRAKVEGQICPRGDVDWYSLDVPEGADLIDLTAGYPSSPTRVSIVAQLFSEGGMTPIPDGEITDTRSGTRKGTISSTVRVPAPGRYLIAVRDAASSESDSLGSYVLSAVTAKDPDTHEPNDAPGAARDPDGKPGWLAYRGDHDRYKVTLPPGSALIGIHITNPMPSQRVLHYALQDAKGTSIGEGDAPPAAKALDLLRLVPGGAAGDYLVDLSAPMGSAPDRRPEVGYTIALEAKPELDANEMQPGGRNDSGTAATCLSGGGPADPKTGCASPYMGGAAGFQARGQIGALGDRDYFRFDVSGGVPAVVEIAVTLGNPGIQLALDLLVPHATSPCTKDSECAAINVQCKSDSDCELSHSCLPAAVYPFCPNGQACRLCAGASACVPLDKPGGKTVCAAPEYLIHDAAVMPGGKLRTAQPVFTTGPRYLVVHDYQDDAFDYGNEYSIDVRFSPEPDAGDQPPAAAMRNNFYNPYPMQNDDLRPSQARAKDISDDLLAGRAISGFISYASDEDWFSFRHPCPKLDCGLVFEWTQPGPSAVRAAFLMRRDDLGIHESWTYGGQVPTVALPGPVTDTFGDGDCHECSFGSARYGGKSYYLQVRAVGGNSWDGSGAGSYSFRLKAVNPGCPLSCSEAGTPMTPVCGCWCAAEKRCPPGPAL